MASSTARQVLMNTWGLNTKGYTLVSYWADRMLPLISWVRIWLSVSVFV